MKAKNTTLLLHSQDYATFTLWYFLLILLELHLVFLNCTPLSSITIIKTRWFQIKI